MGTPVDARAAALAERLKTEFNVRARALLRLVEQGQLLELSCEMPYCFCQKGRRHFESIGKPLSPWIPSADHYPVLASHGGKLSPSNVRLGHRRCNNDDFAWRSRIAKMLDKGSSLAEIAEQLNKKAVPRPHGHPTWTPKLVRKAYVS
jgi:hypothetical protein